LIKPCKHSPSLIFNVVTIDVDEEEEEEEEAYLGLDPPKATLAVDLRIRDRELGDVAVVLASRIAMVNEHL
jgi:hypothetical protein